MTTEAAATTDDSLEHTTSEPPAVIERLRRMNRTRASRSSSASLASDTDSLTGSISSQSNSTSDTSSTASSASSQQSATASVRLLRIYAGGIPVQELQILVDSLELQAGVNFTDNLKVCGQAWQDQPVSDAICSGQSHKQASWTSPVRSHSCLQQACNDERSASGA